MKLERFIMQIGIVITIFLILLHSDPAICNNKFSTAPTTKPDGKPFKLGYLEGGPYKPYKQHLVAIVTQLQDMGWIDKNLKIPRTSDDDTQTLWMWLAENVKGPYLVFDPTAYWTDKWNTKLRKDNKRKVLERLKKGDIDLIVAMGTWAGQDLANNEHHVPVVVCSTSDAVAAGIVKGVDDSGYDHVIAHLDPTRYERQVRLFHEIIGFHKLGVAYENSVAGRSYAALDDIRKVAKEKKFEIVSCYTLSDIPDTSEAEKSVVDCAEKLAPQIDAFYVTVQQGVTLKNLSNILKPLYEHKVPTFSMRGSEEVRYGVLLSIASAGYKYVGRFLAETIAKILNGAKPRDLPQVFEAPPKIAINLEAAQIIGWDPPVDVLAAADEIYQKIEKVDK
ncbi:MAG: ABC transporter substrate-binding protein [Deltaproteobacteria bacterium]|nr:ABC transporter substrate-binding protein [Deltaproteobacteria bacterium]